MIQNFLLNKVVLELRYRALIMLDKPGIMAQKIEEEIPEWEYNGYTQDGITFLNQQKRQTVLINWDKIIISQNFVDNLNQFKKNSDKIIDKIVNVFEIKKYTRIGNRYFFLQEVDSQENGEEIIAQRGFITVDTNKTKGFGDKIISTVPRVVLQKGDLKYRIELKTGRRKSSDDFSIAISSKAAEYNPINSVLYDIDVFQETNLPKPNSFNAGEFIQKTFKTIENNLNSLID